MRVIGNPSAHRRSFPRGPFADTEGFHKGYLHTVPYGYCPNHGTGVGCPVSLGVAAPAG